VNANDTDFEGVPETREGPAHNVDYYQIVTGSYLATMGIPVVEGRGFVATDATGAPVAMVNEALARRFYPNQSPIGRRIRPGGPPAKTPWMTIVGVVKDVKQGGLSEKTGTELYFLFEQIARHYAFAPGAMNMVVRSPQPLEALAPALRQAVRSQDPALPVVKMRTMEDVFGESTARSRFLALLLTGFALLALGLAAVGTYGVLSYLVSERTQEIGVRIALGATREAVLRMMLMHGVKLAAAGLVVGVLTALGVTRVLNALLFGVTASDPVTLGVVAVVIAVVGLTACMVPALGAMRVDPIVVLREE
jgi:predicted permease